MSEKAQALVAMKDIIDRITLVAKDGGRESGLTSGDRAQIMAATQVVAKALDEGDAAIKKLAEMGDDVAKLQSELDQLKAEMSANPVE
jgi:hypothetical protein